MFNIHIAENCQTPFLFVQSYIILQLFDIYINFFYVIY